MRLATIACVLILLGLGSGPAAASGLFVVTSDFQSGSAAYLPPDAEAAQVDLLNLHGDAVARYHAGRVYVLNRYGQDNVVVLDPADLRTPVLQFSVGNGTNPQDIAFAGPDRAYVTRYESASLLVVDPRSGSELGEIDLSPFADGDGLPEMAEMAVVGDRLYVVCQRLAREQGWGPAGVSYLAVVDTRTDALIDQDPVTAGVQGIQLAAPNPSSIAVVGGKLVVAETAGFGDLAGGVEAVDLSSGRSTGLVIGEAALGGDVTALSMVSDTRGYVVVSDASFTNLVRPIDLATGQVGPPLSGHSGGFTPDLVVDGSRLVVADRGSFTDPAHPAGLLIYDAGTGQLAAGPIPVGLPPASIAVLDEGRPTAVLAPGAAALPTQARLGLVHPNPFNAQIVIPVEAPASGQDVTLAVYDLLGRPVRVLYAGPLPAGPHAFAWDGRDDDGRPTGSGAYVVELRQGGWSAVAKLLQLR